MIRTVGMLLLMLFADMATAQDPTVTDGDKYKVLFENERVRVLDYRDLPGERTHQHRHPAFVLYALAAFERTIQLPGENLLMRKFEAGDVIYSETQTHIGENTGTTPTHAVIVEMKMPAPTP